MVVSWLNGDVNERKIIHRFIAFLAVSGQLITMVRMKKYFLHPGDLHLIFNLVYSSESFKVRDRVSFLFLCFWPFKLTSVVCVFVKQVEDLFHFLSTKSEAVWEGGPWY